MNGHPKSIACHGKGHVLLCIVEDQMKASMTICTYLFITNAMSYEVLQVQYMCKVLYYI